jgi:iron complex transport system substrate-binding protein
MKKLKPFLTLLSVFAIFLLTACGGAKDENTKDTKDTPKTEEISYTIEHAMGSTTIEGTPKRVVILTNEGTEALLAMGVTPVGAVQSFTGDPWYDHIADKLKDTKVVGVESEVNVEAIAALKPDLIIGNKMRQEKIYDQLKAIAPTVFAETLRGDWKTNFTLYSKTLNKEAEGNKVLEAYDARITELKEKFGDKLKMEVSMVRFMAGEVRIYHKDTFSGVILNDLGFARPESQNVDDFAERNVTKERIPAMEGDILFYFTYETGDGKGSELEKDWINDPLFNNLEVAKKGQVHRVNDVTWNTAGGVLAANLMLDEMEEIILKK